MTGGIRQVCAIHGFGAQGDHFYDNGTDNKWLESLIETFGTISLESDFQSNQSSHAVSSALSDTADSRDIFLSAATR